MLEDRTKIVISVTFVVPPPPRGDDSSPFGDVTLRAPSEESAFNGLQAEVREFRKMVMLSRVRRAFRLV